MAIVLTAVGLLVTAVAALRSDASARLVPAGEAAGAIGAAAPGSHLRLQAGEHPGPLVIDRPLKLSAEPGATISSSSDAPALLVHDAADVTLAGLRVVGGSSSIEVRHSTDVTIDDVTLSAGTLHGIFVHDAEVAVTACHISGMRSKLAQGFEIINSDTRDPSTVSGCTVEGPVFEGISSHVSRVRFADNTVRGSLERGIVITEMSMGTALRNSVHDAAGRAYYCGDMSRCTFLDNVASRVRSADDGWRSSGGHGLVVHFHSTATVKRLRTAELDGEPTLLILDSHLEPHASSGAPPLAPIAGVGGLYLILLAIARALGLRGVPSVLLPTLALQLGHQLEHTVQIGQILLGRSATHGLAGALVDTEWMHLSFNAALLAGVGAAARQARRRSPAPIRARVLLTATVAVQGYHVIEHLVRVTQYLITGITPAPGIAGALVGLGPGLAWFHFLVNLVVTVLLLGATRATPIGLGSRRAKTGPPVAERLQLEGAVVA